jgi:hypothetical protein
MQAVGIALFEEYQSDGGCHSFKGASFETPFSEAPFLKRFS